MEARSAAASAKIHSLIDDEDQKQSPAFMRRVSHIGM